MSIFLINPFIYTQLASIQRTFFFDDYNSGRATTTATAYTTDRSVSTIETAGKRYAVFWQATIDNSATGGDARIRLLEDGVVRQFFNIEPQDITDAMSVGGCYAYSGGANRTFTTQYSSERAGDTSGYAGRSLVVLELDDADVFNHNATQTATTSTTFQTRASVTVPETGIYIIIASAAVQGGNSDAAIFINGSLSGGISQLEDAMGQDNTTYSPYFFVYEYLLAAGDVITLVHRSNTGTSCSIRQATLLLLKSDKFNYTDANISGPSPFSASTTENAFTSLFAPSSREYTIPNPSNYHLVLGGGFLQSSATNLSAGLRLRNTTRGLNYTPAHQRENNVTTEWYPTVAARLTSFATSNTTIEWQGYSEGNNTMRGRDLTVVVIDLGVPAPPINFVGSSRISDSATLNLPVTLEEDDIVIVASFGDNTAQNLPTGYTNGQNGTINTVNYRWSYKIMGATPDTQVTGLSTDGAHIAICFTGIDVVTPLDVTPPTVSNDGGSASGMPDPPAITTVSNDTVIVALGFLDDDAVAPSIVAPNGYNFIVAQEDSSGPGCVMAAYLVTTSAGTYNPGAFAGDGSDNWVGATLALRKV